MTGKTLPPHPAPERCAARWLLFAILMLLALPLDSQAARVKDIATVKGVRPNQLVGYGLVVGLEGTGDGKNAAFTTNGLANLMRHMGVALDPKDIRVKNVASVVVTATLPPFVKVGQTIDVTLSSVGDATSLAGGTLLATPLKGLDNQVYAVAQGPVSIGGFPAQGAAAQGTQKNHLTVARIPDGATVEREVPVSFAEREELTISIDRADFTTVRRLAQAVNRRFGGGLARAIDGATVKVKVPEAFRGDEIAFLAEVENLEVVPDAPARVVLDERTGTVVMGENVRIGELALSHGSLSLQVTGAGGAQEGPQVTGNPGDKLVRLSSGATLGEVVRALNAVGVAPRDLVAIFQAVKAAGALPAELEII